MWLWCAEAPGRWETISNVGNAELYLKTEIPRNFKELDAAGICIMMGYRRYIREYLGNKLLVGYPPNGIHLFQLIQSQGAWSIHIWVYGSNRSRRPHVMSREMLGVYALFVTSTIFEEMMNLMGICIVLGDRGSPQNKKFKKLHLPPFLTSWVFCQNWGGQNQDNDVSPNTPLHP